MPTDFTSTLIFLARLLIGGAFSFRFKNSSAKAVKSNKAKSLA